jgi:non-canonical purine NTP pyrophosphatase (RdgB/HAM1 family)
MELYFVTGNKNKLQEFEEILEIKLKSVKMEFDEIQAIEVKKVVEHKTRQAYEKIGRPVITEDTGLYFEAWKGLPGALIKWFDKAIGYKNIPNLLKGSRKAKAQTVIGYFDGKKYENFIGEVYGTISKRSRGKTNFGWDLMFVPKGYSKTFAEMKSEEKNKISMRKKALEKFKKFIQKKA